MILSQYIFTCMQLGLEKGTNMLGALLRLPKVNVTKIWSMDFCTITVIVATWLSTMLLYMFTYCASITVLQVSGYFTYLAIRRSQNSQITEDPLKYKSLVLTYLVLRRKWYNWNNIQGNCLQTLGLQLLMARYCVGMLPSSGTVSTISSPWSSIGTRPSPKFSLRMSDKSGSGLGTKLPLFPEQVLWCTWSSTFKHLLSPWVWSCLNQAQWNAQGGVNHAPHS